MKIGRLNKMLMMGYAKLFVLILAGFLLIDFIYCRILSNSINTLYLHWMCGAAGESLSMATVILKILNTALIFLYVGNVCERFSGRYMMQVFSRITKYVPFIFKLIILLIFYALLLLFCSHCIFYCVSGSAPDFSDMLMYYLLDGLSLSGLILLYIILNNSYVREHSLLYIMGILVANTVSPIPIPLAVSTLKYVEMLEYTGYGVMLLSTAVCVALIIGIYVYSVSRRRLCIC